MIPTENSEEPGNTRYIVESQSDNWQQSRQHGGNKAATFLSGRSCFASTPCLLIRRGSHGVALAIFHSTEIVEEPYFFLASSSLAIMAPGPPSRYPVCFQATDPSDFKAINVG